MLAIGVWGPANSAMSTGHAVKISSAGYEAQIEEIPDRLRDFARLLQVAESRLPSFVRSTHLECQHRQIVGERPSVAPQLDGLENGIQALLERLIARIQQDTIEIIQSEIRGLPVTPFDHAIRINVEPIARIQFDLSLLERLIAGLARKKNTDRQTTRLEHSHFASRADVNRRRMSG